MNQKTASQEDAGKAGKSLKKAIGQQITKNIFKVCTSEI